MKKPPVDELSRVRKLLATPQHYSVHQLRIWRKLHKRLKRRVQSAYKRIKEKKLEDPQLTIKLR